MKKTREIESAAGTDELIAVKGSIAARKTGESGHIVPVDLPLMREHINSRIHQSLTDMWLLTTGEDLESEFFNLQKHNGRPIAVFLEGQMMLMESRPLTLDALRAVGIEMS